MRFPSRSIGDTTNISTCEYFVTMYFSFKEFGHFNIFIRNENETSVRTVIIRMSLLSYIFLES